MATKCIYCNSSSYGSCSKSPHKKHEHAGDPKKCVYCGSSSYGPCSKSPDRNHKHGQGSKCVYCGSSSTGSCSKSPHGKHARAWSKIKKYFDFWTDPIVRSRSFSHVFFKIMELEISLNGETVW